MKLLTKIEKLLRSPTKFFSKTKNESVMDVLMTLFYVTAVAGILVAPIAALQIYVDLSSDSAIAMAPSAAWMLAGMVGMYLLMLIGAFIGPWIGALFTHIGVLLFGGEDYQTSVRAVAYSEVVRMLWGIPSSLAMLPILISTLTMEQSPGASLGIMVFAVGISWIIGILAAIHVAFVLVMGFKQYHKMTVGQAIMSAVVIPLIIGLIFAGMIIGLVFLTVGTAFLAGGFA